MYGHTSKIIKNDCFEQIKMIYNTDEKGTKAYTERLITLVKTYCTIFDDINTENIRIFSAPGRTEIGAITQTIKEVVY